MVSARVYGCRDPESPNALLVMGTADRSADVHRSPNRCTGRPTERNPLGRISTCHLPRKVGK
jgi:hypothetical protein